MNVIAIGLENMVYTWYQKNYFKNFYENMNNKKFNILFHY